MPVPNSRLYVMRDDTSFGNGMWWCVWAVPGESIFCGAEGYTYRRMHRTRREAASYGERREGEKPIYWPASSITAPYPKES